QRPAECANRARRARLAAAPLPEDSPPPLLRGLQHRRDRRVARRETEVRAETGVEMHQESGEKLPGERTIGMPPSPAQARLAEFLETAERLKNERAAAGGVLETVAATPPAAWPTLAANPEFQTN